MENPKCPYCGEEMKLWDDGCGMLWYSCPKCLAEAPVAHSEEAAYAAAVERERPKDDVNWHKFDANDLDTYPQAYKSKLLFHRDGYVEEGEWIGAAEKWHQYHPNDVLKPDEVLYWCDLPKPPMEWMLEKCCCFGEVRSENDE